MSVKNVFFKLIVLFFVLAVLAAFAGCDAMDSLFTSSDTYKVNAYVGEMPLNECSYIFLNDDIIPFFEESVFKDPDITSLIILIRGAAENILDWKIVYSLEKETEEYDEAINVESLDSFLPSFKLPENLPAGFYTMVFHIMSGKDILQKTEKEFFYLGNKNFSFDGINIHLPGISDNLQMISRGQLIMLEAKLDFDSTLDPYIVWYHGRNKISEGFHSKGAGNLLWKTPEQSNFYPIRADVFPVFEYDGLTGYQKEISVLVSSKTIDIHLISEDVPELANWYVFEGTLNDSRNPAASRSISAFDNNITNDAKWMPANGVYGLAAGYGNIYSLPKTLIPEDENSWQLLFRFLPIKEGSILSVNFGTSGNVVLELTFKDNKFVLTLSSLVKEVSQIYNLPFKQNSFLTMGINITCAPDFISAGINVFGENAEEGELALPPVSVEINPVSEFQILLGQVLTDAITEKTRVETRVAEIQETVNNFIPDVQNIPEDNTDFDLDSNLVNNFVNNQEPNFIYVADEIQTKELNSIVEYFTAIWDEFAVYNNLSMENIAAEIKSIHIESSQVNE